MLSCSLYEKTVRVGKENSKQREQLLQVPSDWKEPGLFREGNPVRLKPAEQVRELGGGGFQRGAAPSMQGLSEQGGEFGLYSRCCGKPYDCFKQRDDILLIYYCLINHPKLNGLKQEFIIISQSLEVDRPCLESFMLRLWQLDGSWGWSCRKASSLTDLVPGLG